MPAEDPAPGAIARELAQFGNVSHRRLAGALARRISHGISTRLWPRPFAPQPGVQAAGGRVRQVTGLNAS